MSQNIIPRTIVTGKIVDFNKHWKNYLVWSVQTHEVNYDTMEDRNFGAIALFPNGNEQGGYYF